MENRTVANLDILSDQQVANLATKKIFFGHQSVGNNIIQGIRELESEDPRLKLNIVKSADPQAVSGPAFVEFELGHNGSPQSKLDAFAAVLNQGMGAQGGIAILKFCYADIDTSTDIQNLFAAYRNEMNAFEGEISGSQDRPCNGSFDDRRPLGQGIDQRPARKEVHDSL